MSDADRAAADRDRTLVQRLRELFVQRGQAERIARGQSPAERAVFRKLHGTASARLEVLDSTPPAWRQGIFARDRAEAWVRFSSDASPTSPDLGTTLGVGIKLFGVEQSALLGDEAGTADLVMQNHPVFFVDDLREMVDFTEAGVIEQDYPGYLRSHPRTRRILDAMDRPEGSVLTTTYWGILPFHLGEETVRYRLSSEDPPVDVPDDATDYLAVDLATRLSRGEHRFVLSVQPRSDPSTMPLDRATEPWSEQSSPYVPVARLSIARQDVRERGQAEYGQRLAYNIWRTPEANRPVRASSIARARREVYAAGADLRHQSNGEPLSDETEPRRPRPPEVVDQTIVQAVIYPSIGVARLGSSPEEYVIGPEVPEPPPAPPGHYRDEDGRLKRQAARFRIYGVNALGQVVRELSGGSPDVDITWTVQLANTKAAWYAFQLALDIPEASSAPPTTLRNPGVADRARLSITPAPQRVAGCNAGPAVFGDGAFLDKPVYLGQISTDDHARLVVLGGRGVSASCDGSRAITFANNEGWHDDVSDGPVTAEVVLGGQALDVVGAWVVVAPPNYAPQRKSVRTMWDLMRDVAIRDGMMAAPTMPSFTDDIRPLFERMAGLQWVNAGFAAGFGFGGATDLTSPAALRRLGNPSPSHRELRRTIANCFRDVDVDGMSPKPWPWLYGDAMNVPPVASPRQNATLSPTQLTFLQQWADGWFIPDHDPDHVPPRTIDEVPLAEQGDVLTRATLESCLADAFHPGCEMTWPVRAASLYVAPFRFRHAPPGWQPPALGTVLTADSVTTPDGPLGPQSAGDVTRWMAVPWQTDTASCRSGYSPEYDPYVPTFWPARVPNQVLTAANYAIVQDIARDLEERTLAFANRSAWIEPLGSVDYTTQINAMIDGFDHLGVVEPRPGPTDGNFPSVFEVEDQHRPIQIENDDAADAAPPGRAVGHAATGSHVDAARGARRSAAEVDLRGIEKVRRFPGGLGS